MKNLTSSLAVLPWIKHGFFPRIGGVSEGAYATLNCGLETKDNAERVLENRGRVADELGIDRNNLITLRQTHSAKVVTATGPISIAERPEADALVTTEPGLGIAVLTADCAPILIASKTRPVVAAVHAGWRGALGGVIEAAVARMGELGAKPAQLAAVIGPCIRKESYEVAQDFSAPFIGQDPGNQQFFTPSEKGGYLMFDLPGYVAHRLKLTGIEHVDDLGGDTVTDTRMYFSHRRSTLAGEEGGGRQIAVISIDPAFEFPPAPEDGAQ